MNTKGFLRIGGITVHDKWVGGVTVYYKFNYDRRVNMSSPGVSNKLNDSGVNFQSIDLSISLDESIWSNSRVVVTFVAYGPAFDINTNRDLPNDSIETTPYSNFGYNIQTSFTELMENNLYYCDATSMTTAYMIVDVYLNAGGGHPNTLHYREEIALLYPGGIDPTEKQLRDEIETWEKWK